MSRCVCVCVGVCVCVCVCECPVPGTDGITESHQHLSTSQYCIYILHRKNIQNMHYSIFLLSPQIISLPCHDKDTHGRTRTTLTLYIGLNLSQSIK